MIELSELSNREYLENKDSMIRDDLISRFTEIVDERINLSGGIEIESIANEISHSLFLMQAVNDSMAHKK